ncbi:MAG: TetR/AcrR family transcriptional regulator, partial [Bacteroidetes bacterium]
MILRLGLTRPGKADIGMPKTTERILSAALTAFNETGLAQASTRQIAQAAGLSQGNLTYHFATRDDLVYALYTRMIAELDEVATALDPATLSLLSFHQLMRDTLEIHYRYRFLFYDFVSILRTHAALARDFQALLTRQAAGFDLLLQALQARGELRPDLSPAERARLAAQFRVLGNFW